MSGESDADDLFGLEAFLARDHYLPHVTPESVVKALEGFALNLVEDRDSVWLSMAVRRKFAATLRNVTDEPDRPSNAIVREELRKLAAEAQSAWLSIFSRSFEADDHVWDNASAHWDGKGGEETGDGLSMGTPTDYQRFKTALAELDWLGCFLQRTVAEMPSQPKKWRDRLRRDIRVERGYYLAPVFETAFGQVITVNNWPHDKTSNATPFMEFYQRMVKLAFGEGGTPNLDRVLKNARQLYRDHPHSADQV
jgi:hypothetical protein